MIYRRLWSVRKAKDQRPPMPLPWKTTMAKLAEAGGPEV